MAKARRTLTGRLLAAAVGLLLAAALSEGLWRLAEPPPTTAPTIRGADGTEVPLSLVATYLGRNDEDRAPTSPSSRLAPNLELRFCYSALERPWLDADGCVSVRTNSLGFRDLEFDATKPAGQRRVLCVGDSFTFGNGVPLEDTWVQRLEGLLEQRWDDVEVINGGFAAGDHRTGGYAPWIASDGLALDPDLVVIGVCLNDLGDVPMALTPPPPEERWLGGISHVLNALQDRRHRREFEATALPDAGVLLDLVPEPWNAARAALTTLRDLCAERDVELLVVVFPMFFRLEEDRYPFHGLHRAVTEFCGTAGIDCIDLYPTFAGQPDRPLWIHPTDQHANPIGQALIAEALLPRVVGALER
ncbi:hypothetical protein Pla163_20090 [Planctomycetes bacterium Pla163]|uniref:SGNH hydrolase-type esterase domain-containing protein n=1 Tax=Rohdeia mirabilis TaxID=2528008 RepID=A0A518D081_9BACT|nr:hypothetical protein Pla163_20090 [Planctomycetes bacterium Pla163]